MTDIFYKDVDGYTDKLEPLRHYKEQVTQYLMRQLDISFEEAESKAKNIIRAKFKDLPMGFFSRKENGDRMYMERGLIRYLNTHVKENNVIAPSLTTYLSVRKKPSFWSEYTLTNVEKRSKDKKEAHAARAKGLLDVYNFKNTSQSNQKTKNNSLSGLMISPASVIVNPTGHSTLTSMTRSMTALTNANNERMLTGNRAYLSLNCVFNAVVNESTYCNKEDIAKAIEVYNLHVPTVEEVVDVLKYSSDLYMRDGHYYRKYIIPYLEKLTDVERCGIVYSTDLYHLWTYNPELMRGMFSKMIHKVTDKTEPLEDPSIMYTIDQSILFYAHNIFNDELRGKGKDYKYINTLGPLVNNIYHTCLHLKSFFEDNALFFRAFFLHNIAPINSNRMQYVRRRCVSLSDTDSSGFNMQAAIVWFNKQFKITSETIGLAGALTYISSENVVHQLSRLSAYMNVDKSELRRLSMKNEWFWYVFTTTSAAKHYYAQAAIQEGDVLSEIDMEIKGVHLKTSNTPTEILDVGDQLMADYSDSVSKAEDIKLEDLIKRAIGLENMIIESLRRGETKYLSTVNINGPNSYNGPKEKSPYRHHMLWEEVFSCKYGVIEDPPYVTVKIPITLSNKTEIDNWLLTIKDPEFKEKMTQWFTRNNRKDLNNIHLNADFVTSNGFPEEIENIIDIKKVVLGLTKQMRIIITTFGLVLDPDYLIQEQFNI